MVTLFGIHSNALGIAWDGEYFWIGNYVGNVYGYDLSGNQVGSFSVPFAYYPALTWDGEYFIAASSFNHNPTIYTLDYSGSMVASYSNSIGATMYTLGWVPGHDGGNLWMQDGGSQVYRLNLTGANAELITSFSDPSYSSYGTLDHEVGISG